MVGRWQLSLWVLAGLTLIVVALWDNATLSAVTDRVVQRTEAIAGSDQRSSDNPSPSDLAFTDLDDYGDDVGGGNGNGNVLRPTTTTTSTTTTTRPTTSSTSGDPGSATTTPDGAESEDDSDHGTTTNTDTTSQTVTDRTGGSDGSGGSGGSGGDPALTTVFYEDFAAGTLNGDQWLVYDGIGHAGWGFRRPSAVSVTADAGATGGHRLEITATMGRGDDAGRVVTGGAKLVAMSMTSGRYSFRARVAPDSAEATSGVVQLWPADNVWPEGGEINMLETTDNRSTRTPSESSLHWFENGEDNSVGVTHSTAGGPLSAAQWHVYAMTWTRDRVEVSVDGRPPVVLSDDPARVPQRAMDLALLLEAFDTPSAPGRQPVLNEDVTLMVDWIRIERPVSRAAT